jgi:hypothetical protein
MAADVVDVDTQRAVQSAWGTDTTTLPGLFPRGLTVGRLKSLIPGQDVQAGKPTANLDCQLDSRPALSFGGIWLDKRKVTITVRGVRADVVTALGTIRSIFNSNLGQPGGTPFTMPSGAAFLFWEPKRDTTVQEDEATKAGRDVWQGILEALCWTERQL